MRQKILLHVNEGMGMAHRHWLCKHPVRKGHFALDPPRPVPALLSHTRLPSYLCTLAFDPLQSRDVLKIACRTVCGAAQAKVTGLRQALCCRDY